MFKKVLVVSTFFLTISGLTAQTALAQVGLGVSYEIRDEEPTNGFGAHVQFSLFNLPLVSLSARAHYSFYSENNVLNERNLILDRPEDRSSSEIGITAIGSVGLGLLSPYVGVGIGWQNLSVESQIASMVVDELDLEPEAEESSAKYYGVIGAAVSPIPLLRPFIEYRYAGIAKDNLGPSSHGTWVFGVQIRF
jgi:opacity protein-like surface antigen